VIVGVDPGCAWARGRGLAVASLSGPAGRDRLVREGCELGGVEADDEVRLGLDDDPVW
jgi:hypothetical protein